MLPLPRQSLRALALTLLAGGLLAGSFTGCAARRQQQAAGTATAGALVGAATAASSKPIVGAASATPSNAAGDQLDADIQKMATELGNADTLQDLNTALAPEAAAGTPAASGPTATPAANVPTVAPSPTIAPSGTDQGSQIDQSLSDLLDQLNNTDTVPEASNP